MSGNGRKNLMGFALFVNLMITVLLVGAVITQSQEIERMKTGLPPTKPTGITIPIPIYGALIGMNALEQFGASGSGSNTAAVTLSSTATAVVSLPAYTASGGRLLIIGCMQVNKDANAGTVTISVTEDGTIITGSSQTTNVAASASVTLCTMFTRVATAVSHTYVLQAAVGANAGTVPLSGANFVVVEFKRSS